MKIIILLSLLLSPNLIAADSHCERNYSYTTDFPAETLATIILFFNLFGGVGADNCTNSSGPEPFTDAESIGYTWLQIGAGIFAIVLIVNNFFAASFFYKREAKKVGIILKSYKEQLMHHNKTLKDAISASNEALKELNN